MPCGGIYKGGPIGGLGECWMCRKENAEYFCDEWDTFLHRECIPEFLMSEEGKIVLEHGHMVYIEAQTIT